MVMNYKKFQSSYEPPPAPYKPGQRVFVGSKIYTVHSSTHTHTQLEGLDHGVANWIIRAMDKYLSSKLVDSLYYGRWTLGIPQANRYLLNLLLESPGFIVATWVLLRMEDFAVLSENTDPQGTIPLYDRKAVPASIQQSSKGDGRCP